MKNFYTNSRLTYKLLIAISILFFYCNTMFAQPGVCNAGGCGFGGNQFPFGVFSTTSSSFQVVSTIIWAGEWAEYSVTAGCTYEWSLCPADGGFVAYDSELTLYDSSNNILCYNDDLCGLSSKIRWTATYTGIARVLVTQWSGGLCLSNFSFTTLVWRQESCAGGGGGCNSGSLWVSYTPICTGAQETYTGCNFAGEYNNLTLTAGITYTFGSSITTDFITVTNSSGGIITSGTQPVSYTPSVSGVYRIYYHTGPGCGFQTTCRSAWVQCGSGGFNPCSPLAGTLTCSSSASTTMSGSGANWNLPTCDGITSTFGQERIYSFTPTLTGNYNINVSAISGGWVDFYYKPQSAGCSNSGWTCAGLTLSAPYTGPNIFLTAGVPYYILLDAELNGPVNITFNIPCLSFCDYLVPYSGSTAITACSGIICDHAGGGNYSDFANGFTIINPAIFGNAVRLSFTSFALECCCDFVNIYDGSGIGGTLLFSGNCTTLPPVITSNSGPLTVQFTSDLSVQNTGFSANISCVPLPSPTITSIFPSSACAGSQVTITGTNLNGASAVSMNGVSANFTIVNATTITAVVPSNATTGFITVFTPSGNATSPTVLTILSPAVTCPSNIFVNTNPGLCSAVVNYSPPTGTCGANPILTAGLPSGAAFPLGNTTVTYSSGGYPNGAGGYFTYNIGDSNQTIALKACESVYGVGNCNIGSCGSFTYYKFVANPSCACENPVGAYEFIYSNFGYVGVGEDYGGAMTNVAGNNLFTRVKATAGCNSNSWNLAQEFLGQGGEFVSCSFNVVVTDNEPPAITCPANLTVSNTLNMCAAIVGYATPTGTDNCSGATTLQIGGIPNGGTFPIGTTVNTFRVTAANGQTAQCNFSVLVNDTQPPNASCQNLTVVANSEGNSSVTASQINNSSTDNCAVSSVAISAGLTNYTCSNIGQTYGVTLQVFDTSGNSSTCLSNITVTDPNGYCCSAPQAICQTAAVIQLNGSGTAVLTVNDINIGSNADCGLQSMFVSPVNFNCAHVGTLQTVTLTVIDANSNSSTCQSALTVQDAIAPLVNCQNHSVTLSGNTANITTSNIFASGSDNCGVVNHVSVVPNTFTCANVGNNTVVLTVNDGNGNTSTCSSIVTVFDFTPLSIICKNITVNLSGTSVTILPADVFDSGSDNCGTINLNSVTPSTLTCDQLGFSLVQLSANDGNGNNATCNAFVNLIDVSPPVFTFCPDDVVVNANDFCIASASWTDPVVTDNCSFTLQQTEGSPNGDNFGFGNSNVTYIATDPTGATAQCSFIVTVQDVTPPHVSCYPAITVLVNEGNATIVPANLFFFGSDNCGSVILESLSQYTYSCDDVGNVSVTLTVNDGFGNTNTCSSLVTVLDNNIPVAICQNIEVELNEEGTVSIAEDAIDNGSYDVCGSLLYDTDITEFNCSNVGFTLVTLTVDDNAGNTAACQGYVTVADVTPPVANCKNVSVALNVSGNVSISPNDIDNGSTDACGIMSLSLTQADFNCFHIGTNPNIVTLTVVDANWNISTCSATVSVEDNVAPNTVCQNITVELDNTGNAAIAEDAVNNGSNDACGGLSFDTNVTVFNCSDVGENAVVLTVTDAHGNSSTCSATVTVEDNTPPTAVCQNITWI
ncbi:MAG: HYR domain-containing protein [Sphingobacteriales bacterium]|nr:MAG: HYR domain-containing protein [Sphingobacteriales bacterium]